GVDSPPNRPDSEWDRASTGWPLLATRSVRSQYALSVVDFTGLARPRPVDEAADRGNCAIPYRSVETFSMDQLLRFRRAGLPDRRGWMVFAILSGMLVWAAGGNTMSVAQEPGKSAGAAASKEAVAPAEPAPAAPAPSPAAPPGTPGATAPPAQESLLSLAFR